MRSINNFLAALAMLCFSSVNAAPISINFSGLATGTPVTNQFSGVQFSLIGGPGPIGAPTVINFGGYSELMLVRNLTIKMENSCPVYCDEFCMMMVKSRLCSDYI